MGVGGVGGAEHEVGAIAAEERLDSREGLHQVGAVVVSVVEHNHQVSKIINIIRSGRISSVYIVGWLLLVVTLFQNLFILSVVVL